MTEYETTFGNAPPNGYCDPPGDAIGGEYPDDSSRQAPKSPAVLRLASELVEKKVEWLWEKYIPRGAITVIDGDPGKGKSTLTIDVAARVSSGRPMPPVSGQPVNQPANVLLLSAEDDADTVIRPRLIAARADLARVQILDGVTMRDCTIRPPVLPADLEMIQGIIRDHSIALIVIDPVMSYFDESVNTHRDSDVRRVLHRIKVMAEQTGAALVLVRHLNKLGSGSAIYRGTGSIGLIGAARSGLLIGQNPNNPDSRILAPVKCNLCRMPTALEFAPKTVGDSHRLRWIGESSLTADEVLTNPAGPRSSAVDDCKAAIADMLRSGAVESDELTDQLEHSGYSAATIKRARAALGVKVRRVGYGAEGRWMVQPPIEAHGP